MKTVVNYWRYGAVLLSATMFVVVVGKAQGCQRPMDGETGEPEAVSATSGADSPESPESPETVGEPDARVEPATKSEDAGGVAAAAPDVELPPADAKPTRVLPATKSGRIDVLPQKQNAAGER